MAGPRQPTKNEKRLGDRVHYVTPGAIELGDGTRKDYRYTSDEDDEAAANGTAVSSLPTSTHGGTETVSHRRRFTRFNM